MGNSSHIFLSPLACRICNRQNSNLFNIGKPKSKKQSRFPTPQRNIKHGHLHRTLKRLQHLRRILRQILRRLRLHNSHSLSLRRRHLDLRNRKPPPLPSEPPGGGSGRRVETKLRPVQQPRGDTPALRGTQMPHLPDPPRAVRS